MYNGGEAADQMVSYAFKGGEVVLRLSGAAAKNLAVYLTALLKQGGVDALASRVMSVSIEPPGGM